MGIAGKDGRDKEYVSRYYFGDGMLLIEHKLYPIIEPELELVLRNLLVSCQPFSFVRDWELHDIHAMGDERIEVGF